ncbi:MAG: DUF3405 domain-containing protein [Chthoniobacterales bacterium]
MHLAGRKGIQEPQKQQRGDRRCNFSVPSQIQQYGTGIANAEPLPVLGRKSVKAELFMIGPTLVPGHVGFPVLQFFCDNRDFDYYWAIECDVRFSGDWFFFFHSFKEANHDFLACHIRDYVDEPDWHGGL